MTIFPSREPAAATASSNPSQGTAKTTTSPNSAASAGVPTLAASPISAASGPSLAGSCPLSFTSWPPLANCVAQLPPIRPAPTIPILIPSPFLRLESIDRRKRPSPAVDHAVRYNPTRNASRPKRHRGAQVGHLSEVLGLARVRPGGGGEVPAGARRPSRVRHR